VKSSNNKELVDFVFENLEKERGDLQIHIRYSVLTPKETKKTNPGCVW
jgi:hypothetical protein